MKLDEVFKRIEKQTDAEYWVDPNDQYGGVIMGYDYRYVLAELKDIAEELKEPGVHYDSFSEIIYIYEITDDSFQERIFYGARECPICGADIILDDDEWEYRGDKIVCQKCSDNDVEIVMDVL